MNTHFYLVAVLIAAGSALVWNQYDYLRVVNARTGARYPVLGSGLSSYIRRPWRLVSGFDDLVRIGSSRQTDPDVESARRRFLKRRRLVLVLFAIAAGAGLLFSPELGVAAPR